jgi:carbamoyl-phosphate synthase small subunit
LKTNLRHENEKEAALVLEDGTYFNGRGFGAAKKVSGEIVFSTSMIGYPEAMTDPSYYGQILTMTYPLIGNYGVPSREIEVGISRYFESEGIKVTGLVVHEMCENPYHWASTKTLNQWLEEEGVPGIYGVDTRRLAKTLRVKGVMLGILQVCGEGEHLEVEELLREAERIADPNSKNLVSEVSTEEPIYYNSGNKSVVLIDCGVKNGILRNLIRRRLKIIRVPYDFSSKEIMEYNPSGIIVTNGPGDPKKCGKTVQTVGEIIEEGVPTMGICLGNQIIALAMGGDTYKMKFGHRSQNQPALDLKTRRCYITTQNHGYAVKPDSLQNTKTEVWFVNANDRTIEGIRHSDKPVYAVQFHPEASPGPYDTGFLFDQFVGCLKE